MPAKGNQSAGKNSDLHNRLNRLLARRMSQHFLILVLFAAALLSYHIFKFFLMPVFLAAVFSGLTYPMYEKLLSWTRNNKGLSAFLCIVGLVLLLLVPTYIVADLVRQEAVDLYQTHEESIRQFKNSLDNAELWNDLANHPFLLQFNIDLNKLDLVSGLRTAITGLGNFLVTAINKTWTGTFQFVMDFIIMLFTMYYFYKDGDRLIVYVKYLSPLRDEHEDRLIAKFVSVSRATVKGTLLIGLTQGSLGALLLAVFGFKSPVVFGMVIFILSIIPMVGGWLVLYPAGVYSLIVGDVWQGVAILVITSVVVSNIDNVLRPKLVGRDTGMHDLLIFFSSIGGIYVFGVMGFIIGPVITVLFLTILDIYSMEFKEQLDIAQGETTAPVEILPMCAPDDDDCQPAEDERDRSSGSGSSSGRSGLA